MSEGRYTCPKCGGTDVDARPLSRASSLHALAGELMHCRCKNQGCKHEWDEEGCCGGPPEPADGQSGQAPCEFDEDAVP